jgi:hypothetical protein
MMCGDGGDFESVLEEDFVQCVMMAVAVLSWEMCKSAVLREKVLQQTALHLSSTASTPKLLWLSHLPT